jgi:hypothetical protein
VAAEAIAPAIPAVPVTAAPPAARDQGAWDQGADATRGTAWDQGAAATGGTARAGAVGRARAWVWATVALTVGAIAAAVLLAPPVSAPPASGLIWLLFTGSSVHVASTGWFYTQPQVLAHMRQHPARYLWAPLALVAGAGALASLIAPAALQWALLAYFAWQFFHYQKQNLGMAALAASAYRAASLTRGERRALLAAGLAGIGGLLSHPGLLQLAVRPVLRPLFPMTAALFAVAVAAGVLLLARRPRAQRPAGFCAVYLGSLIFSLPVFVFGSPYAAVAGMTIAHGLQYLLLMGLVAGGGARGRARLLPLAALGNIALIGGALLSASSHLHNAQPAVRILYGAYLGIVMAHFVVDAGLWRLRDQFPRSFLGGRLPYLLPARRPTS